MIGWAITRWLIMFIIVIVASVSLCSVALKHEAGTNKVIKEIEEATGIDVIDPKLGIKPGEQIRYRKPCRVRLAPSRKARIIGHTKPGKIYLVLARKKHWRMIQVAKSRIAWAGCKMPL